MKKNIFYLLIVVFAGMMITSCNKEFKRVNSNPNSLENPDATTMLSNTIVTEFYYNSNLAWTLGNGYNQYMTFSTSYYDQPTRYQPQTNETYWNEMYESARDANTLYNLGVSQSNTLLQAIALTLRSYAFAQLTELWGDIPFKQALQGNTGIYTPVYDNQQTVYTDGTMGILPSLKRADSLLKANSYGSVSGDVLFSSSTAGAQVTSWRRFINALRLRYLLRVSGKMSVSSEMQNIVNDGTIMQGSTQSAALSLPASVTPYNFYSLTERSGDYNVKYMNALLYNTFAGTGDTSRVSTYFATIAGASSTFSFANYGGMPMVTDATNTQMANSSLFNASFSTGSNSYLIKARVITYAEQEFILAEAALKGYITTGSAATYYNNAVLGAYSEIGLSTTNANNYLTHTNVTFDVSNALQQIITQKWLANINNGFEGWIEYKRTALPAFDNGAVSGASLNKGKIPLRFNYPTTESSVNTTNYKAELTTMGGKDDTNYKAWW